MKQFAIIGLGVFGVRTLEELSKLSVDLVIIDKDAEVIERYKDLARSAYVTNAINEEVVRRLIPETIDGVVVDLGNKIEASILVTNYLSKMGVATIIAKAETDEHGEILELVGATQIIFPDKEAARRVTPMLVSSALFNYMPLSSDFVIAEVRVMDSLVGKSLIEANLRQSFGINVIALRKEGSRTYEYFKPDYRLGKEDVVLIAGTQAAVVTFSGLKAPARKTRSGDFFGKIFGGAGGAE